MRLDYTDNKNEVRVRIYTSFDYAEMVLFDRPYCELGQQGKNKGWMRGEQGYTHDLRRVNARTDNFDTYFSVVLDDLLTVFHLQRCRSGSEALTWSWDVYDGGFEDGSNLRSGWRSCGERRGQVGDYKGCVASTCCETKQFNGPTSAKMPI